MAVFVDNEMWRKLDLSRLIFRLTNEDCIGNDDYVEECIDEYKKFFFLVSEVDVEVFVPPPAVDVVWQRHLLDTRSYMETCTENAVPQWYIHRFVKEVKDDDVDAGESSGEDSVNITLSALDKHYARTKKVYADMFGEDPPSHIWPRSFDLNAYVFNRKCIDEHHITKYFAVAMPQVNIHSTATPSVITAGEVDVPTIVEELLWVGDIVYDTLPHKQMKCTNPSSPIHDVHFGKHDDASLSRSEAISRAVTEYVKFLWLYIHHTYNPLEFGSFEPTIDFKCNFSTSSSNSGEVASTNHLVTVPGNEDKERLSLQLLTPSKLVDELWHTHILHSPEYFMFCKKYARDLPYFHHSPHYEKKHSFHANGFEKTLSLYEQVYGIPPPNVEWNVLGESGGGCDSGPSYISDTSYCCKSEGPNVCYVASTTLVLKAYEDVCDLVPIDENRADVHLVALPYKDSVTVKRCFRPAAEVSIEFMSEEYVSRNLFTFIQARFRAIVTEGYQTLYTASKISPDAKTYTCHCCPEQVRHKELEEWRLNYETSMKDFVDTTNKTFLSKVGLTLGIGEVWGQDQRHTLLIYAKWPLCCCGGNWKRRKFSPIGNHPDPSQNI